MGTWATRESSLQQEKDQPGHIHATRWGVWRASKADANASDASKGPRPACILYYRADITDKLLHTDRLFNTGIAYPAGGPTHASSSTHTTCPTSSPVSVIDTPGTVD